MTTFTIPGIRVDYSYDTAVGVSSSQAEVTVPSDSSTFSYQITGTNPYGQPIIEINDDSYQILLNGTLLSDLNPSAVEASMSAVTWSGGTTTALQVSIDTGPNSSSDLIFILGGAPAPSIASISDWNSFDADITGVSAPSGAFAQGVDILWSEFDNSTVTEDDTFAGTSGADNFLGGIGDDYFNSSQGNDTYHGGAGTFDQLSFAHDPGGVTANLGTGTATDGWGGTDSFDGIEVLRGSAFDDWLHGDAGHNVLRGLAGNDTLIGGNGTDEARYDLDARYGGTAGVTVNLAQGTATDGFGDSDQLTAIEDVRGSDANDNLIGNGVANTLQGELGNDTLNGLNGADTLDGGAGHDKLLGGGGADSLIGGAGYDTLFGHKGTDMLIGNAGNDSLDGGSHNDTLFGGTGNDKLLGGDGADLLNGGGGQDSLYGGNGNDKMLGLAGNDVLVGQVGADKLDGGAGNDQLFGNNGFDTLQGGAGADKLNGGAGNDKLFGGNGVDQLIGGTGNDLLTGGDKADKFIFAGAFGEDTITDFQTAGTDEKINLAGVAEITSFQDLTAHHLTEVAGNAVIDDGLGNTITLDGVAMADLLANDFIF
ncbi:calcium-binding protein [Acidimangrovimonas pyrenivorans]|uniref:Calcium-binding protein n=1 Tax=Acidimangrovimonas pyrenivorans TaxID=2030798 RepID=A0ABV7AGE2_9RHOB